MSGYLIAAIVLGAAGLALVYIVQTRRSRAERSRRPWIHYLLFWPIVLDADKEERRGRFLTTREWVGLAVVALFIVLAVAFA
jgi:hypothetical protein